MTSFSHLQFRRVLIVSTQDDPFFSYWINNFQLQGFDIHFFPLDASVPSPNLSNLTIHRLFAPLRPRLMLRLLTKNPDQLLHFPNYEFLLEQKYHTEFVYPLLHIEWPTRPTAPISALLRRTGSVADIRPAALARVIKRVKPDLIVSVGLDHAAVVTRRARDRFGPGFPAWLLSARCDRAFKAGTAHTAEISKIFASIDFFAYEREAELSLARKFGLTGAALPFALPIEFDFSQLSHKMPLPPSRRRTIVIESTGDRTECAAIEAFDACDELLQNYMTTVCGPWDRMMDEAVARILRTGRFPIMRQHQPSTHCAPELIGSSRAYVATPRRADRPDLALVFAAAMGAFPIQICEPGESNLADHGLEGLSVAPADADGLKSAVTRVLTDDALVDSTAAKNAMAHREFSTDSTEAINQSRELFDEIFVGPRAARTKGEVLSAAK